jgi:hypothetical protein
MVAYVLVESFIPKKGIIFWKEASEGEHKFDFMFTNVS